MSVSRAIRVVVVAALTVVCTAATSARLAHAATPPDVREITARCLASDSANGSFSSRAPVKLWVGSTLFLNLSYRNDDVAADPAYAAHFTAMISQTTEFGPAHTVDNSTHFGGVGL